MLAFNHEPYIGQAIESVLRQEVDFEVELIIGEDRSPDGTRAVVMSYGEKYPNVIRLLLHNENIGMIANSQAVYKACRGRYVAFLEGDDYWVSTNKLSRQVAVLVGDPSSIGTFHQASNLLPDGSTRPYLETEQCRDLLANDFVVGNMMPTCSVVVHRNDGILEHPLNLTFPHPDWCYHVLNLENGGKYGFVEGLAAVRRIHAKGYTSSTPRLRLYRERQEGTKIMAKRLHADEAAALTKIRRWEIWRAFNNTRLAPGMVSFYLEEDWEQPLKVAAILGVLNHACALCHERQVSPLLQILGELYAGEAAEQAGDEHRAFMGQAFMQSFSCPHHSLSMKWLFMAMVKQSLPSALLPGFWEMRRLLGRHFQTFAGCAARISAPKRLVNWLGLLLFAPRAATRQLLPR